jgi:hypothetical protein
LNGHLFDETNQELLWHIVHNVDVEASKRPLFARSPYLEAEVIISEKTRKKLLGQETDQKNGSIEKVDYLSLDYAETVIIFISMFSINNK